MVDWDSLKQLRRHRDVLTLVIVLLIGLFFFPTTALENASSIGSQYTVIAKSGLKIRAEPNINSSVLITVPYNSSLNIITTDEHKDMINGDVGTWYEVEHHNIRGFAWSKFISNN